jgi:Bacterial Ig-like domain (group 3)/Bacterial Ig-like domain (group 2)
MHRIACLAGFLLIALSGCGGDSSPAKPTVSLSASATTIDNGAPLTLTWSSRNASACTAGGNFTVPNPDWSGPKALSGTQTLDGIVVDTTFTLTCTGMGGTATARMAVAVVPPPMPTLSFNASSAIVAKAGADTLAWSSTNATSCTASGGWTGAQPTSGSSQVGPITTQTVYTLFCEGLGGTVSDSVTVGVSSTLPPAGPIATLAAGVIFLGGSTPAGESNVVSQNATSVTLECCAAVAVGQVFILGGYAYKATDEMYASGTAGEFGDPYPPTLQVITVEAPPLNEVFDQLDITGTYTLSANQMVAQSAAQALAVKRMRPASTGQSAAVPIALSLSQGSLAISGTGTVMLQAVPSIHYSKSSGFSNSSIAIAASAQASASVAAGAVAPAAAANAGHYRIPIPLTVVDAQSNLVAVSAAFIDVPVSVVAQPAVNYGISYGTTFQGSATATVAIASGGELTTTVGSGSSASTFAFTDAAASVDPSTPVATVLGDSLFAGIELDASLQILNLVNVVTVDSKIGDRYGGQLTILASGANPSYCGGSIGDVEQDVDATLGLPVNVAVPLLAPIVGVLDAGNPQPISAYCGSQPIVTAGPEGPAAVFSPLTVSVRVAPVPGVPSAPAPTGVVQVGLDGAVCEASINGAGAGSCTLTPSASGTRSLTFQYQGDTNYPAGVAGTQGLSVALAQDLLSLAETPNPASPASGLSFNFSVSPIPANAAAAAPTGSVTVYEGASSCTAPLGGAGSGSCSIAAPPIGQTYVTAAYSGDGNYAAQVAQAPGSTVYVADNTHTLDVYVIKLQLQGPNDTVAVGGSFIIGAVPNDLPPNAVVPLNLLWTSSNPAVATVAGSGTVGGVGEGTVTGVAVGTATITATDMASQATGSVLVTVTAPTP